jgi:hypothetical protein
MALLAIASSSVVSAHQGTAANAKVMAVEQNSQAKLSASLTPDCCFEVDGNDSSFEGQTNVSGTVQNTDISDKYKQVKLSLCLTN